jgi:hypothetical protein
MKYYLVTLRFLSHSGESQYEMGATNSLFDYIYSAKKQIEFSANYTNVTLISSVEITEEQFASWKENF